MPRTAPPDTGAFPDLGHGPSGQGRMVGDRPVQTCQPQRAGNHAGGLPRLLRERHPDRQTALDRRIDDDRRATGTRPLRRRPGPVRLRPDRRGAAGPQRGVVARPGRDAVFGRRALHPAVLSPHGCPAGTIRRRTSATERSSITQVDRITTRDRSLDPECHPSGPADEACLSRPARGATSASGRPGLRIAGSAGADAQVPMTAGRGRLPDLELDCRCHGRRPGNPDGHGAAIGSGPLSSRTI